jgi:hypothetical protein
MRPLLFLLLAACHPAAPHAAIDACAAESYDHLARMKRLEAIQMLGRTTASPSAVESVEAAWDALRRGQGLPEAMDPCTGSRRPEVWLEAAVRHSDAALAQSPPGDLRASALWTRAEALRLLGREGEERTALAWLAEQHPDSPWAPAARTRLVSP